MYAKNETVVYGSSGICKIEDIQKKSFAKENRTYYVLKPVYESASTLYVPVDNEHLQEKMRHVLSKEEIDTLLGMIGENTIEWVEDDRQRAEEFSCILAEGMRVELLDLMKCLYRKKDEFISDGRKFKAADEKMLFTAEKMVNEEFAYVLGINKENVSDYILSKLEGGVQ